MNEKSPKETWIICELYTSPKLLWEILDNITQFEEIPHYTLYYLKEGEKTRVALGVIINEAITENNSDRIKEILKEKIPSIYHFIGEMQNDKKIVSWDAHISTTPEIENQKKQATELRYSLMKKGFTIVPTITMEQRKEVAKLLKGLNDELIHFCLNPVGYEAEKEIRRLFNEVK